MNEEVVWLYKVLDVKNMTNEQLQKELDNWSNHITPNELIQQDGKLIVKYQSMLKRNAYLTAVSIQAANTFKNAVD